MFFTICFFSSHLFAISVYVLYLFVFICPFLFVLFLNVKMFIVCTLFIPCFLTYYSDLRFSTIHCFSSVSFYVFSPFLPFSFLVFVALFICTELVNITLTCPFHWLRWDAQPFAPLWRRNRNRQAPLYKYWSRGWLILSTGGGIILATSRGANFAPNPLRTLTDHISPSKASFFLLFSRIRIILGFETQLTESGKRVKDNNE